MCMPLSGMAVTGRRVHLSVSSGRRRSRRKRIDIQRKKKSLLCCLTSSSVCKFMQKGWQDIGLAGSGYLHRRTRWRHPKRLLERDRNPANTRLADDDDDDDDDEDDDDDVGGFSTSIFPPPRLPPSVTETPASTSSTRANFPLSTMRKVNTSVHASTLALEKLIP
ncbi:hypothetical protein M0802_006158 [Mischocyttarus mexicanus]|nr:hypothetical protein M0802_006158 [Mischocyttarus mexicanus]